MGPNKSGENSRGSEEAPSSQLLLHPGAWEFCTGTQLVKPWLGFSCPLVNSVHTYQLYLQATFLETVSLYHPHISSLSM